MRSWLNTVGSLIEFVWLNKKPITGSNLPARVKHRGYGFIEFEISSITISTVFRQPLICILTLLLLLLLLFILAFVLVMLVVLLVMIIIVTLLLFSFILLLLLLLLLIIIIILVILIILLITQNHK